MRLHVYVYDNHERVPQYRVCYLSGADPCGFRLGALPTTTMYLGLLYVFPNIMMDDLWDYHRLLVLVDIKIPT